MTVAVTTTTIRHLQGNQPLLLDDPHTAWVVKSGAIALFAMQVRNGMPEGERQFLFTVNPGEALFGAALCPEQDSLGLVAVALESTELLPLPLGNGEAHSSEGNGDMATSLSLTVSPAECARVMPDLPTLLVGWLNQFGQISNLPKPLTPGSSPEGQHLALAPGQVCHNRNERLIWVQVHRGRVSWLGDEDLALEPSTGWFPLGHGLWLQSQDYSELFIQTTDQLADQGVFLAGLVKFHTYFLRRLVRLQEEVARTEQARFQRRQQLNQQATQETLRDLAALLNPRPDATMQSDSPLLIAAGAVGHALGVTIHPPLSAESLNRVKEPLEAIARASHLRLRRVLLRDQWWRRDGGPLLAYTRQDHLPVALIPVSPTRYELFDPIRWDQASAGGNPSAPARVPVDATVAQRLEPVAYMFYRPLPEGTLNAWNLLTFALHGRQQDLLTILLTGIAATLLGMLVPQATAVLIDNAIPYGNAGLLVQMGIGLLAAAVGGAIFQLAQAIASMRIETISDSTLQAAVWDRLLKLRTDFFRQYSIGDLNSRVSAITAIRRKLSGTVLQSIFSGFFSLLNLALLFYYSPALAALALVIALVIAGFTATSGLVLVQKQRPLLEIEGDISGTLVQLISGVAKLRIAAAESRAFAHWGRKYTRQLKLLQSAQRLEDGVTLFNTVMPTFTTIALYWLASTLIDPTEIVSGAGLTAGTFLAFNVAFGTFIGGVTSLSLSLIEVLDIAVLWRRSQPILAAQPEVMADAADPGQLSGRILVDHLTFRYRDDGPLILDDVSIQAEPGEFIALVGPSGSGKSTILRLLLGFETPMSGTIYYDGQDLAGLDVAAVRRQLGVVLQQGRISAGTLFENIASGALISLDDAWAAAEMSGLAEDIRALPMQMHTLVNEGGTNLSGGQRQRLIIARALALRPRILLLDEATSALDNRTQAIVSQSLDRLHVTRLVIAHRLSTIRNADRIYVLEAGRVVQQGSFADLAEQPGLFARLIQRQLA
jgi:ATP-binding cassette subfamily C protein